MASEEKSTSMELDDDPSDMNNFSLDNPPVKDILSEIMWRLEPISIVRCKCLNKSWYNAITCLVTDTEFVTKHLRSAESSSSTTPLIIFEPSFGHELNTTQSNRLLVTFTLRKPTVFLGSFELHCDSAKDQHCYLEVYHCNGVFCFIRDSEAITLYNIALHEYDDFRPESEIDIMGIPIFCTRFGSDLGARIHKIVRLLDSGTLRVQVYAPGKGTNAWREIDYVGPSEVYDQEVIESHVSHKGNCFWLMFRDEHCRVLRFDVVSEAFHVMTLPNNFETPGSAVKLAVFDDKLRFFSYAHPEENGFYESIGICAMDFDGVDCKLSWTPSQRVEVFEGFSSPLEYVSSDEILLDTVGSHLICYNLDTGNFWGVSIPLKKNSTMHYSGHYVKSMVSFRAQKQSFG